MMRMMMIGLASGLRSVYGRVRLGEGWKSLGSTAWYRHGVVGSGSIAFSFLVHFRSVP